MLGPQWTPASAARSEDPRPSGGGASRSDEAPLVTRTDLLARLMQQSRTT